MSEHALDHLADSVVKRLEAGEDPRSVRWQLRLTWRQMRELIERRLPNTVLAPLHRREAPWGDNDEGGKAPIDHEIEKLLRRPVSEKADCPICWRCSWYYGLKPARWRKPTNVDPEVQSAIEATEREKIRIAGGSTDE